MRVAGIAVHIPASKRPAARLAVLDDASGSAKVSEVVDFSSDHSDLPQQLHESAAALRSRLTGLGVDRVVVRRADYSPASNKPGPKLRLLMEGALTSAAVDVVPDTHIGDGKDLGALHGSDKAAVEATAEALLASSSQSKDYAPAAGAALAGFALP